MDMAENQITERTQEDPLTQDDLNRIEFDISATINPERNKQVNKTQK
jgi:hypothetical protein